MRAQLLLLPWVVVTVGCELMSGLSDLEKDPTFDPDGAVAEASVTDTSAPPADTGAPGTDTGTAPPADTGTMPPADTAVADTAKPPDAGGCGEPESITFGGHCYFPLKTNLSFTDAKNACVAKGAYLAVITSMAENEAIGAIDAAAERWIGLSRALADPIAKESYKWSDGTAFDAAKFDGWGVGEPNDAAGDAVRMRPDKLWYDRTGATTTAAGIHAICEKN